MSLYIENKKHSIVYRIFSAFLVCAFAINVVLPPASAQTLPGMISLPSPTSMIGTSPLYVPALIKGIEIHPENPLLFDFIVDTGHSQLTDKPLQEEIVRMAKYFLAALTVPEDELWVNLSPYEKDRVISDSFGKTRMGMDLLAGDYILKQLTASLMYPKKELGEKFWNEIRVQVQKKYGIDNIPMDQFNKVWIVPEQAAVYETGNRVFVVNSHLKVMMESDYFAMQNSQSPGHKDTKSPENQKTSNESRATINEIMRYIVIPAIEKEVNEGEHFARLRQINQAAILAKWYKQALKESLLGRVYVDQEKMKGIDDAAPQAKEEIYQQYIEAFKKGVYDYIKEDYDPQTQEVVPRRYFAGGVGLKQGVRRIRPALLTDADRVLIQKSAKVTGHTVAGRIALGETPTDHIGADSLEVDDNAMVVDGRAAVSELSGQDQKDLDRLLSEEKRRNGLRKQLWGSQAKQDFYQEFAEIQNEIAQLYEKAGDLVKAQEYFNRTRIAYNLLLKATKKSSAQQRIRNEIKTLELKDAELKRLMVSAVASSDKAILTFPNEPHAQPAVVEDGRTITYEIFPGYPFTFDLDHAEKSLDELADEGEKSDITRNIVEGQQPELRWGQDIDPRSLMPTLAWIHRETQAERMHTDLRMRYVARIWKMVIEATIRQAQISDESSTILRQYMPWTFPSEDWDAQTSEDPDKRGDYEGLAQEFAGNPQLLEDAVKLAETAARAFAEWKLLLLQHKDYAKKAYGIVSEENLFPHSFIMLIDALGVYEKLSEQSVRYVFLGYLFDSETRQFEWGVASVQSAVLSGNIESVIMLYQFRLEQISKDQQSFAKHHSEFFYPSADYLTTLILTHLDFLKRNNYPQAQELIAAIEGLDYSSGSSDPAKPGDGEMLTMANRAEAARAFQEFKSDVFGLVKDGFFTRMDEPAGINDGVEDLAELFQKINKTEWGQGMVEDFSYSYSAITKRIYGEVRAFALQIVNDQMEPVFRDEDFKEIDEVLDGLLHEAVYESIIYKPGEGESYSLSYRDRWPIDFEKLAEPINQILAMVQERMYLAVISQQSEGKDQEGKDAGDDNAMLVGHLQEPARNLGQLTKADWVEVIHKWEIRGDQNLVPLDFASPVYIDRNQEGITEAVGKKTVELLERRRPTSDDDEEVVSVQLIFLADLSEGVLGVYDEAQNIFFLSRRYMGAVINEESYVDTIPIATLPQDFFRSRAEVYLPALGTAFGINVTPSDIVKTDNSAMITTKSVEIELKKGKLASFESRLKTALGKDKDIIFVLGDRRYKFLEKFQGYGDSIVLKVQRQEGDEDVGSPSVIVINKVVKGHALYERNLIKFFDAVKANGDQEKEPLFAEFRHIDTDLHFIEMEFVEGSNLRNIKNLDERFALVMQVMEKLAYYQTRYKVVLKDLDDLNVIVMPNGQVRIIDYYEMYLGSEDAQSIEDVKSSKKYLNIQFFGLMLYSLFGGRNDDVVDFSPLYVMENKDIDIADFVEHGALQYLPGVPKSLQVVINRAILFVPANVNASDQKPYESIAELQRDLEQALDGAGVGKIFEDFRAATLREQAAAAEMIDQDWAKASRSLALLRGWTQQIHDKIVQAGIPEEVAAFEEWLDQKNAELGEAIDVESVDEDAVLNKIYKEAQAWIARLDPLLNSVILAIRKTEPDTRDALVFTTDMRIDAEAEHVHDVLTYDVGDKWTKFVYAAIVLFRNSFKTRPGTKMSLKVLRDNLLYLKERSQNMYRGYMRLLQDIADLSQVDETLDRQRFEQTSLPKDIYTKFLVPYETHLKAQTVLVGNVADGVIADVVKGEVVSADKVFHAKTDGAMLTGSLLKSDLNYEAAHLLNPRSRIIVIKGEAKRAEPHIRLKTYLDGLIDEDADVRSEARQAMAAMLREEAGMTDLLKNLEFRITNGVEEYLNISQALDEFYKIVSGKDVAIIDKDNVVTALQTLRTEFNQHAVLYAVDEIKEPLFSSWKELSLSKAVYIIIIIRVLLKYLADPGNSQQVKDKIMQDSKLKDRIEDFKNAKVEFSTLVKQSKIVQDKGLDQWAQELLDSLSSGVGGIDLNPELFDLQIKRDGSGVPLPLPQQPINTIHIEGFYPILINVTPVQNLPMMLGLTDEDVPHHDGPQKTAANNDTESFYKEEYFDELVMAE